jgi:hypothetical protein
VRNLGVPLPPQSMPGWRGGRPLKAWRYLGVYMPELMLCVGDARIGPARQRWWALAWPDGRLRERTTIRRRGVLMEPARVRVHAGDVRIDLELDEPAAVETISPAGGGYVWTAKRAPIGVTGMVTVGTTRHHIDGPVGFVDDSAGYHDRHTAWRWSAGVGTAADGRAVAWNLVDGIHDDPRASERTLWVDGEPQEIGPNSFAADLGRVEFDEGGALDFTEWATREENVDYGLMKSRYRQPFGSFTGELPGGLTLAEGYGVMEDHDVLW